jgi:hypothetical protein
VAIARLLKANQHTAFSKEFADTITDIFACAFERLEGGQCFRARFDVAGRDHNVRIPHKQKLCSVLVVDDQP